MAVQHTNFVFRVLNGVNAGATVRLKTGSLVVGSAMTSDIILHDENIADQHVQLLITPVGITLQPLAQPLFVDGKEVTADSLELQIHQVVRLGDIEFLVSDGRQLLATSPSEPGKGNNNRRRQRQPARASAKREATGGNASSAVKKRPVSARRRSALGGKALLGLGLGLLLLANLLFFLPRMHGFMEQIGFRSSDEEQAAVLLAELGQQDFRIQEEPDGSLSLRGYTRTIAERNELLGRVRAAGLQADMQVWAKEEMVDRAAMITRALGEPGIEVSAGDALGELLIGGFVSDRNAWERVRTTILSDTGGIQAIEAGGLRSLDEYMASFMQFIDKNGLSSRPVLTVGDGRVIVSGELTKMEIETLEELRQQFVELHGNGPAIVMNVVNIHDRIELAIRSVSVGDVPFLVSKDGKKYMEGSALGDSYFVKTIKPDHIVLTSNGIDIPFYYGIEEGNNDAAN